MLIRRVQGQYLLFDKVRYFHLIHLFCCRRTTHSRNILNIVTVAWFVFFWWSLRWTIVITFHCQLHLGRNICLCFQLQGLTLRFFSVLARLAATKSTVYACLQNCLRVLLERSSFTITDKWNHISVVAADYRKQKVICVG